MTKDKGQFPCLQDEMEKVPIDLCNSKVSFHAYRIGWRRSFLFGIVRSVPMTTDKIEKVPVHLCTCLGKYK